MVTRTADISAYETEPKAHLRALIVTWKGGGASQPALGLGRRLAARGHEVRVVAPATFAGRVSAAGCHLRPVPSELEFDPSLGSMVEDQPDYCIELFFGPRLPAFVAAELDSEPADVVIVDYMLRSVACMLEARDVPVVLLRHMTYRHGAVPVDEHEDEWGQRWQYRLINEARMQMGLEPLPVGPEPLAMALGRRADGVIVAIPRELDPWPTVPEHVVHVGALSEEASGDRWHPPWEAADPRPLVVISMSTMYMRHEDILGRAARAAADCGARVLVLTGFELDTDTVSVPPGVVLRSYVPHVDVLPHASLVITHGGIGTLIAAAAAGVPTVCVPLGRDQHVNAERAQELGASVTLSAESDEQAFGEAIETAFSSPTFARSAQRLAGRLATYQDGQRAVDLVERLVGQRCAITGATGR